MLSKMIDIIGVPLDLGVSVRGASLGPDTLRVKGLIEGLKKLGIKVEDKGNLMVPNRDNLSEKECEEHFLTSIANVCNELKGTVFNSLECGHTPVILGGDHSIAIGSVGGVKSFFQKKNKKLGLIWFDAHADMNTVESSPSGNIHGMPLATILGYGHPDLVKISNASSVLSPERVAIIGLRSIDAEEKNLLIESGIKYYAMEDLDLLGINKVIEYVVHDVCEASDGVHISFDIDVLEPKNAPGVTTAVSEGLKPSQAMLAFEKIVACQNVVALDFVELNPCFDIRSKTSSLVIELIKHYMTVEK